MRLIAHIVCILMITLGCSKPQPKAIAYGKAECAHCNMLITDKKFGAELVTDKGRYYFFDSAECLFDYLKENPDLKYTHILVTHFMQPDLLADAATSFYVISPELPSPMGAFLTAYPTAEIANQFATKHGGEVFSFKQLAEKFSFNATIVSPN